MSSRNIKLVEICSDIAGRRQGASMGIEALKKSCEKLSSDYFDNFIIEEVKDENYSFDDGSEYKNAKYIDKVYLVIERMANKI